jgi:hypothetical protein
VHMGGAFSVPLLERVLTSNFLRLVASPPLIRNSGQVEISNGKIMKFMFCSWLCLGKESVWHPIGGLLLLKLSTSTARLYLVSEGRM